MDDWVDIQLEFENGARVQIEWNRPFTIKQTRGLDPWMFTLSFSDIGQFPPSASFQKGARCKFVFETPGANGGRTQVEWQLYLVRLEPSKNEEDLWVATFADERWFFQYPRYTLSYNVQWPDGSYRRDSLPPGGSTVGWRAFNALVDACQKMGYKLDTSQWGPETHGIILPNNLGNSPGGGWVDASAREILEPMLISLGGDLIVNPNRDLALVRKQGDHGSKKVVDKLRAMTRISDTVAAGQNGYEQPRKLRVLLEIIAEAALESELSATTSGDIPVFNEPVNIMPRLVTATFDPDQWWFWETQDLPVDTVWEDIPTELIRLGYLPQGLAGPGSFVDSDTMIGNQFFLPNIIPIKRQYPMGPVDEPGATAQERVIAYQKKIWTDAMLRQCWHSIYRIAYPTDTVQGPLVSSLRSMAGLQFGRLTPAGDVRSGGAVYASWCEELAYSLLDPFTAASPSPLDARFSDNHDFDATRAAPFTVKWLEQSGNDLIFQITPTESRRLGQSKVYPGKFSSHLSYGDYARMLSGLPLQNTALQRAFSPDFDFRLYLSGRLIAEDKRSGVGSPLGTIEGRHLVIEKTLFPQGSIESFDLSLKAVTANYGFSKTQMAFPLGSLATRWPELLLNQGELRRISDEAVLRMKEDFTLGRAGGILVAGVQPVAQKLYTGGEVHEMSVVVGNPDPWSVTTQYIVVPGINSWTLSPDERDGKPPAVISNG